MWKRHGFDLSCPILEKCTPRKGCREGNLRVQHLQKKEGTMEQLRTHLMQLSTGPIQDVAAIQDILASCWHELDGNETAGMEGYKLRGRMEEVTWSTPFLQFAMERHGDTAMGSVYADVQHWSVDIEIGKATLDYTKRRTVGNKARSLNVEPLADTLTRSIVELATDPRLRWDSGQRVKVLITEIIPATNKQTTSARRRRFWNALEPKVGEHGWKRMSKNSQFLNKIAG